MLNLLNTANFMQENPSNTAELEVLKEHLNELREKLRTQASQHVDELDHMKQREENLRKTLLAVQEKHKQEVTQLEGEHHTQLQVINIVEYPSV